MGPFKLCCDLNCTKPKQNDTLFPVARPTLKIFDDPKIFYSYFEKYFRKIPELFGFHSIQLESLIGSINGTFVF